MNIYARVVQGLVLGGFVALSSGCIIAPDHDRDEHEHEHEHGDRHCDEHDEHCRDR